jgi:hypothetical protein
VYYFKKIFFGTDYVIDLKYESEALVLTNNVF